MKKIDSAIAHAKAGWPVFPCHNMTDDGCSCRKPNCHSPGKHPRTPHGLKDATTDLVQIRKWWERWPDANIAGRCDGVAALDVDVRDGKKGFQTLEDLEAEHEAIDRVLVQRTGSGGLHIITAAREGVKYPAKAGRDVEIKAGAGAYLLLPSSDHESGGRYRWEEGDGTDARIFDEIPTAPKWFGGSESRQRPESRSDESSRSLKDAARRAPIAGLAKKRMKEILEGLPNDWTDNYALWLKVGMAIHHQSEGADWGLKLWHWFSEVDGKYLEDAGPEELNKRWKGFGQGDYVGREPCTFRTLIKHSEREADEDEEPDDEGEDEDDAIARLNEKHALVRIAGKTRVLNKEDDGRLTWSSDRDFLNWYVDDKITMWSPPDKNGKAKAVPVSVGKLWWNSPKKLKYEGITMLPEGDTGKLYNLWRGWSVKQNETGSCERFLDHVYENVCNGEQTLYRWFMAWLAQMVQDPQEKPGVAVALKGKRGVGKSIIGDVMHELMTHHSVKISQPKHLTGNFNAHLAHALLVRVEEAFWVGDRAGEKVLRDMVTGGTVRIESKGVDSTEIASFHRYLFTSNEQWVVPAGFDERRFCVIHVKPYRIQNRPYFIRLLEELRANNGEGYGALLHYLKALDISSVDVGKAPMTAALAEQKIASLTGLDAWWAQCVHDGEPPASKIHFGDEEGGWEENSLTLPTSEVREDYERWLKGRKYQSDPIVAQLFTRRLRELCPSIRVSKLWNKGDRMKCLIVPPLAECRADLDKQLGQPFFALDD